MNMNLFTVSVWRRKNNQEVQGCHCHQFTIPAFNQDLAADTAMVWLTCILPEDSQAQYYDGWEMRVREYAGDIGSKEWDYRTETFTSRPVQFDRYAKPLTC